MQSTAARGMVAAGLAIVILLITTAAFAAKPGPGTPTGTASVFVSNPVEICTTSRFADQKDSAAAVPAAAYHTVTLTNLDGSGFLRGRWAEIIGETGNPAYSPTNTFIYNRSQDEFEQVMAYYWITESQKYIQSLGFGSTRRPVNKESQRLRINQYGVDNSFATTHKDEIRLGKGGVDDAEDGEVILHEYGHAIHFSQNFAFASTEAGSISEGFGDYWAVTTTRSSVRSSAWHRSRTRPASPTGTRRPTIRRRRTACGGSTRTCTIRRTSSARSTPTGGSGRERSGTSATRSATCGPTRSSSKGSSTSAGPTMPELATATVAAAKRLYGAAAANTVRAQFQARGIL